VTRHEPGPDSLSALRKLLAETRRRGHAVEVAEVTPGFATIAVAVLDHTRHPVASVAVTVPRSELGPDLRDVVVAEVGRSARAISARISGHTHATAPVTR
jgi:DNA-binding IclR family transcriptional regulator